MHSERQPLTTTISALAALVVAALMLAWAPPATAQSNLDNRSPTPTLSLQRFRPAPNPGDFLTIYGASVEDHMRLSGGFYFNYATDPLQQLISTGASSQSVIAYQVGIDAFVSLSLYDMLDVGLIVPAALAQDSDTRGAPFDQDPAAAAFGDIMLTVKGQFISLEHAPVGFGAVAAISFPSGDEQAFYGDAGVGAEGRLLLDYIPYGDIRLGFNLGYRYRPGGLIDVGRYQAGDAIIIGGAGTMPLPVISSSLDLLVEAQGEITVESGNSELVSEERPVEFQVGGRYRVLERGVLEDLQFTATAGFGSTGVGSPSFRTIFGVGFFWVAGGRWKERDTGGYLVAVGECPDPTITPQSQIPARCIDPATKDSDGDGVPDVRDACPFVGSPGAVDERGCPSNDRDQDGIPDDQDACPDVPEDTDGHKDDDGCPEPDNDGDGIIDLRDKCPLKPEVINGIDDEDGCPDVNPNAIARVIGDKVEILEQVFFESNRAIIKQESLRILDEVAELLVDNPHIANIIIEGHTDDRGDDDYNKQLSQQRAQAVLDYLADRGGVQRTRLSAIGYGEERPIADNETSEGRAKNRRVEFTISGQSADDR